MVYAIILNPREEGREAVDESLRRRVCYLDKSRGSEVFLYVDEKKRWEQQPDPVQQDIEIVNTDKPYDFNKALEHIRYEFGLCIWNPAKESEGPTHAFIADLSDVEFCLEMIEQDHKIKLNAEKISDDMQKLFDYQIRVNSARMELRRQGVAPRGD